MIAPAAAILWSGVVAGLQRNDAADGHLARELERRGRLSTSRKLSSESVQLANLGRATPIKQRRRLTSAARPRSYCEPRSMQSRSGQARGGSERQYESSDKKKRSISATSGHSRWWRWAFMVGGANFHPGCGRSAPTCTPPPHAHACAQSCKFFCAALRSSQSDRISADCYMKSSYQ